MTTIIIGNISEGSKHWSEVDFMKRELAQRYRQDSSFMQNWEILPGGVRVHVRMISGRPHAFIYANNDGYEFFAPYAVADYDGFWLDLFQHTFFEGAFIGSTETTVVDQVNPNEQGIFIFAFNLNQWFSKAAMAATTALGRYFVRMQQSIFSDGVNQKIIQTARNSTPTARYGGGTYYEGITDPPLAFPFSKGCAVNGTTMISFHDSPPSTGGTAGTASSADLVVQDIPTKQVLLYSKLIGTWPKSSFLKHSELSDCFWSFNRDGTRACTVVNVADWFRYGMYPYDSQDAATPEVLPSNSSYVVELAFSFDDDGAFLGAVYDTIIETPDYCMAVDYDWTTLGNELITAQLVGVDYRHEKAALWQVNTSIVTGSSPARTWRVGDHIRVELPALYGDLTRKRPGNIYEIIGFLDPENETNITVAAVEWSAAASTALNAYIKATQSPTPEPEDLPYILYYKVTEIPEDPDPENPPPADPPVLGGSPPTHTTGSATNGNVTLTAIEPKTAIDRTVSGLATEWAASASGFSVGDTIKTTQTPAPALPELAHVKYYEIMATSGDPPHEFGTTKPSHVTGIQANGDYALKAVPANKPIHHTGKRANGSLLLKPLVKGQASEWEANGNAFYYNRYDFLNSNYQPTTGISKVLEVGDLIKVTAPPTTDGTDVEVRHYTVVSIPDLPTTPLFGPTAPSHTTGTVTNGNVGLQATTDVLSATDVWLQLKYLNGTVLQSLELAHNADQTTGAAPTGTWYEKTPGDISFLTDLTGLDLRVRGATAYSNKNASVWATLNDREWTNGADLPQSGITTLPVSNYYVPRELYKRIKFPRYVRQSIAAVPTLTTDTGEIRDACVYAPYITDIGKTTETADPAKAIDFRIYKIDDENNNILWENIEDGNGMVKYYHRNSYDAKFPGSPPHRNRYFEGGIWFKNKDTD